MTSEKERKNREELFKLMAENPELPVVPMVDSEIVCDDYYSRWLGSWGSCYIGEYYCGDERIFFREDDDEAEIEAAVCDQFGDETWEKMTEEEAKAEYASLPWVKAIIVEIDLPE